MISGIWCYFCQCKKADHHVWKHVLWERKKKEKVNNWFFKNPLDFWILDFGFKISENSTYSQLIGSNLALCFPLALGSFCYCLEYGKHTFSKKKVHFIFSKVLIQMERLWALPCIIWRKESVQERRTRHAHQSWVSGACNKYFRICLLSGISKASLPTSLISVILPWSGTPSPWTFAKVAKFVGEGVMPTGTSGLMVTAAL